MIPRKHAANSELLLAICEKFGFYFVFDSLFQLMSFLISLAFVYNQ